jgi:6-pyruvoyltetrahydropterin/6-carboxytetrahydropterin synthase
MYKGDEKMMIRTHVSLDSAHKLNLPYVSKCNNLHGHRWEIDVEVDGEKGSDGMVVDFSTIKNYFEKFDHVFLNNLFEKDFETTAENLIDFWLNDLGKYLSEIGCKVYFLTLTVAETPKNIAKQTMAFASNL